MLRDESRLRAFLAVADAGGFSAAARATGQTQPAISTLVAALEDRVGVPLFVRGRGGARLTPAGAALRPHVAHLLGTAEEAQRAVDAAGREGRRHLRVGGGEVLMTYLLPPALARLRDQLPGLEATFTVADETAVLAALREHRIDVALLTDAAPADGLRTAPFADDELVLIGADALDADSTHVTRAAGAADRRAADAILARCGLQPRLLVAETFEAVKACVAAGLGAAIVPGCAVNHLNQWARPIDSPLRYVLATRDDSPPLAEPLLDALRR